MKQAGLFFSILFAALIFAPGVAAWFLGLRGPGEEELPISSAGVIQFPSQNVVDDFTDNREVIDAA
jgi:hypothetical protein